MNINDLYKIILSKFPYFVAILMLRSTNWLFQGILFASKTEKIIKICIDLFLTSILIIIIYNIFPIKITESIFIAFIISHSINWTFATNIWSVRIRNGKKINSISQTNFKKFLLSFQKNIQRLNSIHGAAIFGSLSAGKAHRYSDVDVKIFRKAGFYNLVASYLFLFLIRTKANFYRYPLDIYVEDNINYKLKKGEIPIIIHDPDFLIRKSYKNFNFFDKIMN